MPAARVPAPTTSAVGSLNVQRPLRLQQPPVYAQVADRMLGLAHAFIQAREVEMRIGKIRIRAEGLQVGFDGLLVARDIFQEHTEIEVQSRIRLTLAQRLAIHALRLLGTS